MTEMRDKLIAEARAMEPRFDELVAQADGPGAFEGVGDRELAMALETFHGHGGADEEAGSAEFGGGHIIRADRVTLVIDSAGFRTLEVYGSAEQAAAAVAAIEAMYYEEDDDDE